MADSTCVKHRAFLTSQWTKNLTPEQTHIYMDKLQLLDITDPYHAPSFFYKPLLSSLDSLPGLSYPDIYNYLIGFPSQYNNSGLKSFKSLEAYRWNRSGFVNVPAIWNLTSKGVCLVTAKVS